MTEHEGDGDGAGGGAGGDASAYDDGETPRVGAGGDKHQVEGSHTHSAESTMTPLLPSGESDANIANLLIIPEGVSSVSLVASSGSGSNK